MEWSKEEVVQLLELYRDRPVLWDSREAGYKDRNDRNQALTEISRALDVEKDEIDRKIKNLMSHFSRECKKEKDTRRGRSYKSKWFAYDAMMFLKDRPATKRVASSDAHDFSDSASESSSMGPISSDFLSGISIIAAPETALPRKRFKRRTPEDESPPEIRQKDEIRISAIDDKFSLWAKVWGSKLRELPTEQAIHAEKLINDVLYEASLANLSRKCSLNIPSLNGNET